MCVQIVSWVESNFNFIVPRRLAGGKNIDRGIIMFQFLRRIVCVDDSAYSFGRWCWRAWEVKRYGTWGPPHMKQADTPTYSRLHNEPAETDARGPVAHIIQNLILYIMCVYENV